MTVDADNPNKNYDDDLMHSLWVTLLIFLTLLEILCPAQLQLDNGQFWPRKQWFKIEEQQEFSCREGLTLSGSAKRNCTGWGHWTGTPPVCIDQSKHPLALKFIMNTRQNEE